jgi:N6-L-threonylcarbamoyladenine synthase
VADVLLGIETSCDETSAAVLVGDAVRPELASLVILSQDVHAVFGGVVPELASRAHLRALDPVVRQALAEAGIPLSSVDAIAVTRGPGLVGALLVGVSYAKTLGAALGRPVVGVHHLEGHLFAPTLEDPDLAPPFVALLVSGGHTLLLEAAAWGRYRLLGQTRDDAAGEAFDKVAALLELGYPGGPPIEELARTGTDRFRFPRPMLTDGYDFSFSGLKTAVLHAVRASPDLAADRADLARSFQDAVLDVLVEKTARAVAETGHPIVVLGGGVACSRALSRRMAERLGRAARVAVARPRLNLDNAAMIARAGWFRWSLGEHAGPDLDADPSLPLPGLLYDSTPPTRLRAP